MDKGALSDQFEVDSTLTPPWQMAPAILVGRCKHVEKNLKKRQGGNPVRGIDTKVRGCSNEAFQS